MRLFYARPNYLFDSGTEADLVEDYRDGTGMFYGLKNGRLQYAVCRFYEFKIRVTQSARSVEYDEPD